MLQKSLRAQILALIGGSLLLTLLIALACIRLLSNNIDDRVKDYIVDVVFATREPQKKGMKELAPLIEYGASPRASIALNLAARAHAFLRHRGYVTPEDVKAIGPDVLRHRMVLSYEAEAEEVTAEQIVRRVFEVVEVP